MTSSLARHAVNMVYLVNVCTCAMVADGADGVPGK